MSTVIARAVAQSRIDDDEIICSVDHADSVGADNPWGSDVDSGETADDKDVEVIDRSSEDAHTQLTRTWLGDGDICTVLKAVKAAMRGNSQRAQVLSGVGYI